MKGKGRRDCSHRAGKLGNGASSAKGADMPGEAPLIGIIMGSRSDWETMRACRDTLREFGVPRHAGRAL